MPCDDDARSRPRKPSGRSSLALERGVQRRLFTAVVEDADAALAPELLRLHELFEAAWDAVAVVFELALHRVRHRVHDVETDQIAERERAHRVPAAQAHRGVDAFGACDPRLERL